MSLLDAALHIMEVMKIYYTKFSLFAMSFVSGRSGYQVGPLLEDQEGVSLLGGLPCRGLCSGNTRKIEITKKKVWTLILIEFAGGRAVT